MKVVSILAVILSFISAGLWLWSATLPLVLPMAYPSGPPKEVQSRMRFQALLNGLAAAATGSSALLQAIAVLLRSCDS